MLLNIETLSLISTVQAAVLAVMLWAGTQGDAGRALTSLRLRAVALAVEAAGWATLAAHHYLSPAQLLLGGNALNLLAQAMGVLALRMLLNQPLRWRLLVGIVVIGWMGEAWFGQIQPDYRNRVLWGSVALALDVLLSVEALLGSKWLYRSRARNTLLLILGLALTLLVWRNGQLWLGQHQPDEINVPSATNLFYVMFSGLQPLFASIGFLLLYNEILQRELHQLARVDPLTGVSNRLAINEALAQLLKHPREAREGLGVLMIDADHFKSVNDRFGHAGGDVVLQALVSNIRGCLRQSDVIGRIGGEEFVLLLPQTSLSVAMALGERVRRTLESSPLAIDGELVQLTVSVGVAIAGPALHDGAKLLQCADRALYAAKRAGRNRVMTTAPCDLQDGQPASLAVAGMLSG
jgi:diguanylate cyclase (GGDEF)-like protein